jgi:formate hydrogenlyase subunit 4
MILAIVHLVLGLAAAPLLLSLINRTKALFAGRVGQPWLQPYFDLWKLLHKGAVYSRTTTWIFRAGPMVGLAAMLAALLLMPFGGRSAVLHFPGDLILFVYLFGVARLAMVLMAMDTGSPFEGMGASREVWVSALAEPALMLALAAVARQVADETHTTNPTVIVRSAGVSSVASLPHRAGSAGGLVSLSFLHNRLEPVVWGQSLLILGLVAVALFVVLLAEASRIPVDDPTTHLELTMIHEVMILDHGGPDHAFILYTTALKFWLLATLLVAIVLPARTGMLVVDELIAVAGVLVVTVSVGVVESVMARLRLSRVPQLLIGASSMAALAFVLQRQGGGLVP